MTLSEDPVVEQSELVERAELLVLQVKLAELVKSEKCVGLPELVKRAEVMKLTANLSTGRTSASTMEREVEVGMKER